MIHNALASPETGLTRAHKKKPSITNILLRTVSRGATLVWSKRLRLCDGSIWQCLITLSPRPTPRRQLTYVNTFPRTRKTFGGTLSGPFTDLRSAGLAASPALCTCTISLISTSKVCMNGYLIDSNTNRIPAWLSSIHQLNNGKRFARLIK